MIEPDLLRIQRRAVRRCRTGVADFLRLKAEIQMRSRAGLEKAQGDSSRLELRVNEQVEEVHMAFMKAKETLRPRGLQRMVQMAPSRVTSSPSRTNVTQRLLELVAETQASERLIASYLAELDRAAVVGTKVRIAIAATLAIGVMLLIWLIR